jgi:glucose dehydrogenase
MNMRAFFRPVSLALLILPIAFGQSAKETNAATEWRTYNHDLAGTRFSPLSQINTSNVTRLTQAWVYRPAATGARPSPEVTPIVVNGVMYLTAGNRVIALEPETGKEVWRYDVQNGPASQRGVAYWPGDRDHPPRILFTAGRRLIALNAVIGEASTGFGNNGEVDMTVGYGAFQRYTKMWQWLAPPWANTFRSDRLEILAASISATVRNCGIFTRSRARANQAVKPGKPTAGKTDRA